MEQLRLSEQTMLAFDRAEELLSQAEQLKESIDEFWRNNLAFSSLVGDFTSVMRGDQAQQIRFIRDQMRGIRQICDAPEPEIVQESEAEPEAE